MLIVIVVVLADFNTLDLWGMDTGPISIPFTCSSSPLRRTWSQSAFGSTGFEQRAALGSRILRLENEILFPIHKQGEVQGCGGKAAFAGSSSRKIDLIIHCQFTVVKLYP